MENSSLDLSYSWFIVSKDVAIKQCPQTIFSTRFLYLNKYAKQFFEVDKLPPKSKVDIELIFKGKVYKAYLITHKISGGNLMWHGALVRDINLALDYFKEKESIFLKVVRIGLKQYEISFSDIFNLDERIIELKEQAKRLQNRTWLGFANEGLANHRKSLKEKGFVSWNVHNRKLAIGDIVYLYMSDDLSVRFKTVFNGDIELRQDGSYWKEEAPVDLTYRLNFVDEYVGNRLGLNILTRHGLKSGSSLELLMCNNQKLFDYIEEEFTKASTTPRKIEKTARICWNTEGWRFPSGAEGKSKDEKVFECYAGYGHEEWLLDFSKKYNGYHYGFLQELNIKTNAHEGQVYDIHLFTISPTKKRLYIGCLHNAECLTIAQSDKAEAYYRKKGWYKQMQEEVEKVNGVSSYLGSGPLFNIRFKVEDAEINFSDIPVISSDDPNVKGSHYNLMDKKGNFVFEKVKRTGYFKDHAPSDEIYRYSSVKDVVIDPKHKQMENKIFDILQAEGYSKVYRENQHVDITAQTPEGSWHMFELKTASAKQSIREALGQILEYAHYPSEVNAEKLFIVGPDKPKDDDIKYLSFLREHYHLPIWYRWYSEDTDKLSKEY